MGVRNFVLIQVLHILKERQMKKRFDLMKHRGIKAGVKIVAKSELQTQL